MTILERYHNTIAAVAPVETVRQAIDNDPSTLSFVLKNTATEQQYKDAQNAHNNFDFTKQATDLFNQATNRNMSKALLANNDPNQIMLRAILKVVFQSIAEVRAKNGLPNKTWEQAMAAVQQVIDSKQAEV